MKWDRREIIYLLINAALLLVAIVMFALLMFREQP